MRVFYTLFTAGVFIMGLILIGERWGLIAAWVIIFAVLAVLHVRLEESKEIEDEEKKD